MTTQISANYEYYIIQYLFKAVKLTKLVLYSKTRKKLAIVITIPTIDQVAKLTVLTLRAAPFRFKQVYFFVERSNPW